MKLASLRSLLREPAFSLTAILMLGLGLGATSAVFALVDGVLLKPLPYPQPERLVSIREVMPRIAHLYPTLPVNARHFVEWRKACPAIEAMSVFQPGSANLSGSGDPVRLDTALVSANLFRLLGVQPALGRDFRDEEEADGQDGVVILTDSFWRRRLHGDPSILGRPITLNGRARVVVGILGPDFRFPDRNVFAVGQSVSSSTDIFLPKVFNKHELEQLLGTHNYGVIARLKPGATRQQAISQLQAVQARMEALAGQTVNLRADVAPLLETVAGKSRRGLLVLMAAIAALLLIVCVNLANLLLARSERRSREFAVRAALGAGRAALIRQAMGESLILAAAGALLAAFVAASGIQLLKAFAPAGIPRLDEVQLDGSVLGFSAFLALLTALLFGFLPAWRAGRANPQEALGAITRGGTGSARAMRLRGVLVASEVGLSALLLILAGMLLNSFVRLVRADKGFRAPTVLAMDVGLSGDQYKTDAARDAFFRRLLDRLSTRPGVESAAISSALPLEGETWIDGASTDADSRNEVQVNVRFVSADYFRTIGIPVLAGRSFTDADRPYHRTVISKNLAAALWPGQDPVGRRLTRGNNEWFDVIGVAGDVRANADHPPVAMMYRGYWDYVPYRTVLVARASGTPQSIAGALRAALHATDADVPAANLRTMSEILDSSIGMRRFQMLLAGGFALISLLVAGFGIYAVVSYTVARRTAELGIRAALGAQAGQLYGLIIRQGMAPVAAGLLAAAGAALFFGRLLGSLLYEIGGRDPLTIAAVTVLLALISFGACLVPARRASRLDPLDALRDN
ncbi:MAG TPA: ABC transporter permease [Candidatus Sulfopaludibacter sp.]|jgi:putative ABC transport system permease protein|nr:ABC transporter permease [Candidatus Sulfopaludibacter sp.]